MVMPYNSTKSAVLPRTIKAHLLLAELQAEARAERFSESFIHHFADDGATGAEPSGFSAIPPRAGGGGMTDLDVQIDAAHRQAQEIENQARQVEARIIKAGATPLTRQYGRPVDTAAIKQNLTLVSVLNRRDPALASFLGVQTGDYIRQAEERATRELQAQGCDGLLLGALHGHGTDAQLEPSGP